MSLSKIEEIKTRLIFVDNKNKVQVKTNASKDDLAFIAEENACEVYTLCGDFKTQGETNNVVLSGVWSVRWINTQGTGNQGTLVILPLNAHAKRHAHIGKVKRFVGLGFTEGQANVIAKSRAKYKFEVAGDLLSILDDNNVVNAFLRHPLEFGRGTSRSKWVKDNAHLFVDGHHGLSASRELAVAMLINELRKHGEI